MNLLVRYGLMLISAAAAFNLMAQSGVRNNNDMQSAVQEQSGPTTIKWYTFEEAVKLNSGYPKKKIFVDVYTDWCGWCKKMDAVTFSHPEIASYINAHYWAVKLNAEGHDTIVFNGIIYTNTNPPPQRGNHQLAANLLSGQMTYPSYVFLNEENQKLTVVKGFIKAPKFEPIIHYFGDNAHFQMAWEVYSKSFVGKIPEEAE